MSAVHALSNDAPLIRTFTGRLVNPLSLRPDDIDIVDVAHALSNLCRFGGHTRRFYSVAQHSVLVARELMKAERPFGVAQWGLLHDASEAYLIDLPRPLKRQTAIGDLYREAEAQVMAAIASRFHLTPSSQPDSVDYWDLVLVETERRDLINRPVKEFEVALLPDPIIPIAPTQAEMDFLELFAELFGEDAA